MLVLIRMLQTRAGAENMYQLVQYKRGHIYLVTHMLAMQFLQSRAAKILPL